MTTAGAYGTLLVVNDVGALARVTADRLCDWATETSGPVCVALSDGSSPQRTYQERVSRRLSRHIAFLVSGAGKCDMLRQVLFGQQFIADRDATRE